MKKSINIYSRMFRYTLPQLPLLLLSVVLSLIIVFSDSIGLWLLGSLPQSLFSENILTEHPGKLSLENINTYLRYWTSLIISGKSQIHSLARLCIIILFVYIVKNMAVYINSLAVNILRMRTVLSIRKDLFVRILNKPISFFDRNRSTNMVNHVLNDTQEIMASISDGVVKIFVEPVRILVTVGLLSIINIKLTLAVFLIIPIMALFVSYLGKTIKRRYNRWSNQFAQLIGRIAETISGIRAVKMNNTTDAEADRFQIENSLFMKAHLRTERIRIIQGPITELVIIFTSVFLLWIGGQQILNTESTMTPGDFFRFLILLFSLLQPVKNCGGIYNAIQSGIAAGERVFNVMDQDEEPLFPLDESLVPKFTNNISFSNVSFAYPGTTKQVINNLSFVIPKGKMIALVGGSGAGKSTILDLLPRFYTPTSGNIMLDGTDVLSFDLTAYRHLFGIVAQECFLFNDTVRSNIAYGVARACSDEEIMNAAQTANAIDFIQQLPKGLDTEIGERGITLSGGQRQRLAIARAILRNPEILILDEATSSLDTESERLVQEALDRVMRGRTTLVVAHRLSTVQHADQILVLEEGCIMERGTHESLLSMRGRYRELYDLQFGAGVS